MNQPKRKKTGESPELSLGLDSEDDEVDIVVGPDSPLQTNQFLSSDDSEEEPRQKREFLTEK